MRLLLGSAYGRTSPVKVFSEMFYLEVLMKKGQRLVFPAREQEVAAYVISGHVQEAGSQESLEIPAYSMLVCDDGADLHLEALADSRVMLLGGMPLGPRFIEWNFVSSSKERIAEAKLDWQPGPRHTSRRFHPIPGDDGEFIPLPPE